jgi:hypothetical protein
MSLKTMLSYQTPEINELAAKRHALVQSTFGIGLRQLFADNPILTCISKVRSDSYDDSSYYDADEMPRSSTLTINGIGSSFLFYDRSARRHVVEPGHEEERNLYEKVMAFFNTNDAVIDTIFGGWSEIKAEWDQDSDSVDVQFLA